MLRGRHQYKLQEINLLGGMIKPCGSPLSLVTSSIIANLPVRVNVLHHRYIIYL